MLKGLQFLNDDPKKRERNTIISMQAQKISLKHKMSILTANPFVTIIKVLLLFLRVTLLNDKFIVICKYNHTNTIGNYKNVHCS